MAQFMEKLAMGGYGSYVWSAVFAFFIVLFILYISNRRKFNKVLAERETLQKLKNKEKL